MIVGVLEEGVKDGSIRADLGNRIVAATALWGFMQGVIQVASTNAQLIDAERPACPRTAAPDVAHVDARARRTILKPRARPATRSSLTPGCPVSAASRARQAAVFSYDASLRPSPGPGELP